MLPPITFTDQDFVGVDLEQMILWSSRSKLNALGVIVSTPHFVMKFPSSIQQIVIVQADKKMAQQCYVNSLKVVNTWALTMRKENNIMENIEMDPRPLMEHGLEPIENL
ncbi:hypothetical protein CR513_03536, partial [Mucuna pruriens]